MKQQMPEIKRHFKMYKSGKLWLVAGITAASLMVGGQAASAADNVQPEQPATTASTVQEQPKTDATTDQTQSGADTTKTDTTTTGDAAQASSTATNQGECEPRCQPTSQG